MTVAEAEREWRDESGVFEGRHGSVEIARDVIQNQLKWLEYVSESEFTDAEAERLLRAFGKLYSAVRPITEKYID